MIIIQLAVIVLFGWWGYNIMKKKNRNTTVGMILGGLLGLIGIIICYAHKDKSPETVANEDLIDSDIEEV